MNVRSRSLGLVLAADPLDRALGGERLQLGHRVGRDEHDAAVAGEQALDLLEPDLAAADDEAAPPGQLQAGDVERRLEHPLHAGLVAEPAAELADALLALIRGGRHSISTVLRSVPGSGWATSTTTRCCAGCTARAPWRSRARARCSCRPRIPVAFAGFFAHTGALDEPYERLSRTAVVMDTIGFGSRADADRATRRVRAMHRRVRGVTAAPAGRFPAGTPYAADDPALLLWILACLADSALVVYQKYVRTLTPRRARRLLARLPADRPPVRAARRGHAGHDRGLRRLHGRDARRAATCTSRRAARELAVQIVLKPPVPLRVRPLLELANQITVGLLPGDIRRQYGLSWDPGAGARAARRGGVRQARRRAAAARAPAPRARARGRRRRFIPEGDDPGPPRAGCSAASEGTPHEGAHECAISRPSSSASPPPSDRSIASILPVLVLLGVLRIDEAGIAAVVVAVNTLVGFGVRVAVSPVSVPSAAPCPQPAAEPSAAA